MNRDLLDPAHRRDALLGTAKIERALQADGPQHLDIGIGEVAKMIGAEDLSPAHGTAISGGISPEVAEIAGAGEIEVAGVRFLHGGTLRGSSRPSKDGGGGGWGGGWR